MRDICFVECNCEQCAKGEMHPLEMLFNDCVLDMVGKVNDIIKEKFKECDYDTQKHFEFAAPLCLASMIIKSTMKYDVDKNIKSEYHTLLFKTIVDESPNKVTLTKIIDLANMNEQQFQTQH